MKKDFISGMTGQDGANPGEFLVRKDKAKPDEASPLAARSHAGVSLGTAAGFKTFSRNE